MKRQTVLALLNLVSESLKNIEILHSQVVYQLQELESREILQNERTLQRIKGQLIKRGKLLSNCAQVNRKTLKKQVAKMDEYEEWIGALSGKIKSISDDGVIEVEGAGIQVFEKKKKEAKPTEESTAA